MSKQVLDRKLAKNLKCHERRKKSRKFVYVLAKQCKSPFNLTDFSDKKKFKILIMRVLIFSLKSSYVKLVGSPCSLNWIRVTEILGIWPLKKIPLFGVTTCLQFATTHSLVKIRKVLRMEDTEASIRDLPLDNNNHRGGQRKCILSVVLVLMALILAAVISAVVMAKATEEDLDQQQKTLVIKIPQSK